MINILLSNAQMSTCPRSHILTPTLMSRGMGVGDQDVLLPFPPSPKRLNILSQKMEKGKVREDCKY